MSEVEGPGTGCSKHTGGSRSAIEHYHKLRDELQKEPNLFECFEQMHKKKDGMFVDERSKRIAEEIQAHHDAATQEAEGSTESPNIDMSQLYVDVVGGIKKQRIYGLGTKSFSFITGTSCGSSATSQLHQDAMKEMMNQHLMDELRRNGIISTSMAQPQNTQAEHSVNSNDENLGED
nr:protein suppressor of K(+) transport growth defect 1 [Ipomoea batatas]